jgi:protein-disulfide isomerase-like protein with CxxC motif
VDTYKTILKRVKRHYKEGADAVEMELLKEIKLDFG